MSDSLKCPECGKTVSKDEPFCSYCRATLPSADISAGEGRAALASTLPQFPFDSFESMRQAREKGEISLSITPDTATTWVLNRRDEFSAPQGLYSWSRLLTDAHCFSAAVLATAAHMSANWVILCLLPLCFLGSVVLDPVMGGNLLLIRRAMLALLAGAFLYAIVRQDYLVFLLALAFALEWILLACRKHFILSWFQQQCRENSAFFEAAWLEEAVSINSPTGEIYSSARGSEQPAARGNSRRTANWTMYFSPVSEPGWIFSEFMASDFLKIVHAFFLLLLFSGSYISCKQHGIIDATGYTVVLLVFVTAYFRVAPSVSGLLRDPINSCARYLGPLTAVIAFPIMTLSIALLVLLVVYFNADYCMDAPVPPVRVASWKKLKRMLPETLPVQERMGIADGIALTIAGDPGFKLSTLEGAMEGLIKETEIIRARQAYTDDRAGWSKAFQQVLSKHRR